MRAIRAAVGRGLLRHRALHGLSSSPVHRLEVAAPGLYAVPGYRRRFASSTKENTEQRQADAGKEGAAESSENGAPPDSAPKSTSSGGPKAAAAGTSIGERTLQVLRSIVDGVKDAHQELFGAKKTTFLKRQVGQASTFRRKASDNADDEEEDVYSGPTELVVVKAGKSPWEAMRERLQDSPFIREMIRNSRKVAKAASETDIGKTAVKLGQSVRDKIEVCMFWVVFCLITVTF